MRVCVEQQQVGEPGWVDRTYTHPHGVSVTATSTRIALRTAGGHASLLPILALGAGIAMVLEARGATVLHGTTVRLHDRGIVVCGPSGVGKSSFTAALLAGGAELVADDLCAVDLHDGRPLVRPGFGRLKLWADTAGHFDLPVVNRIHPDHDKYSVPVPWFGRATRVDALIVLERGSARPRQLRGGEAVLALLANHRLPEIADQARLLHTIAQLVATARVWAVPLPGELAALGSALDAWRTASGYARLP